MQAVGESASGNSAGKHAACGVEMVLFIAMAIATTGLKKPAFWADMKKAAPDQMLRLQ